MLKHETSLKTGKEDIMSKIGLKLIVVFLSGLLVTILVLSIISTTMSSSIINNIVQGDNISSVNTVQGEITDEIMRLRSIVVTMDSLDLSLKGYEDRVLMFWNNQKERASEFLALYDESGTVYFKTDNYELADFDRSRALQGGWMGFVNDSKMDLTIQVCVPIERDGNKVGAALCGMYMSDNEFLDEIKEQTDAEITLFSGNVRFSTTLTDEKGQRAVGTTMADNIANQVLTKGEIYQGEAVLFNQKHYVAYVPMPDINGNIIGAYFSGMSTAETDAGQTQLAIITLVVAVVIGALMVVVIVIANKKILIDPIKEANIIAEDMSHAEFRKPKTTFKFARDELGDFVVKLRATKDELNKYIDDINSVLSEMATGNFTVRPKVEYHGDFAGIKKSFDEIEDSLADIIGNIGDTSREVRSGAEQISEGSSMLADGTSKQASAIEELSATINEIAVKVNQTAQNASDASGISTQTADKITFQNNEVKNMLGAMDEIKEKSDQIQNIIKAIDDIAFQTNILSLNAAIEAARAGAAGKGFAVVADEVRNLAAKSAESAKQTGELINATIEAVNKGTVIAQSTAQTMKEVTALSERTNEYISDITSATEEQSDSINQIKTGIESISQVVQQNSATSQQTAASCQELSNQAAVLENQIEKFTVLNR